MADPDPLTKLKQLREKDDIQNGRFFAKMGDVWGVDFQKYGESHWAALQRSFPDAEDDPKPIKVSARRKVSSGSQSDTSIDPYSATIDKINSDNDGPAEAASATTESDASTNAKKQIWPIDISGENYCNPKIYRVAHLLPAGQKEHEEWFGVGAAVLGIPIDASTETKLMATRGVKRKKDESGRPGDESTDKKETDARAVNFTEGTNTQPRKKRPKERFDHTGVVHFVSNKIRMKYQGAYFDGKTPLSLLVPCMTLEQARGWRGEAYKAVFLAGLPNDYPPPEKYNTDVPNFVEQAYIETGFASERFYYRYVEARAAGKLMEDKDQAAELEKARKLLEDTVLGLSHYVKSLKDTDLTCLQQDNREQLEKRSQELGPNAPIPKKVADPSRPVLFVDFGPQTTGGNGLSHPAPDPLLLVTKAGTVWGRMLSFQLLASAEEPTDEEDSLQRLAEEAWLAKFGSRPAPPVPTAISVSPFDAKWIRNR